MRGDIRSALSSVSRNAQVSGIIGVELIALAIFIGWHFNSILLGAASLVILVLIWRSASITVIAAFILTGAWGYLGWFFGTTGLRNFDAGIVLGAIGLLIGYAIHLRGLGFIRGLN